MRTYLLHHGIWQIVLVNFQTSALQGKTYKVLYNIVNQKKRPGKKVPGVRTSERMEGVLDKAKDLSLINIIPKSQTFNRVRVTDIKIRAVTKGRVPEIFSGHCEFKRKLIWLQYN